jgi:hypothetical protein
MYPAHGVALFPPFPQGHRVFVAMSFDPRYRARWTEVIAPAIARVSLGGTRLDPFRIDGRAVTARLREAFQLDAAQIPPEGQNGEEKPKP